MKTLSALLAFVVVSFALLAVACSGVQITIPSAPSVTITSDAKPDGIVGKMTAVDFNKNILTLDVDGKKQEIAITKDTKFLVLGQPLPHGEVAHAFIGAGDLVVKTEKKDGKDVAVEVKVK
jgi:hypothetical protein